MRLRYSLLAIALSIPLMSACMGMLRIERYTAVDGSTKVEDGPCGGRWWITDLLDRPEVRVRVYVEGVAGSSNTFFGTHIVVQPLKGIAVRLSDTGVKLDSPDFRAPLVANANSTRVYRGTDPEYYYVIQMPNIPDELSMSFPKLELNGELVELRSLVLRRERTFEPILLMCQ
jgi:hypothetical protein